MDRKEKLAQVCRCGKTYAEHVKVSIGRICDGVLFEAAPTYYECCKSHGTHTAACDFYHGRSHQRDAPASSPALPGGDRGTEHLKALVEKWQAQKKAWNNVQPTNRWESHVYGACADELAAVLASAPQLRTEEPQS